MNSSGFFVLAYASPPDFMMTDRIGEYTPLRIDTDAPDLTTQFTFDQKMPGVRVFTPSLDATGGLRAEFLQVTSSQAYSYAGNYLLVLEGSCDIEGTDDRQGHTGRRQGRHAPGIPGRHLRERLMSGAGRVFLAVGSS
jgi:hypothetical protein